VIAQHYRRHRHQEFLRFLKLIDAAVPNGLDLHLVLDNYATHKTPQASLALLAPVYADVRSESSLPRPGSNGSGRER
jgi:hypothetical protein